MTVNLTIDGKQVVVEGPATILQAADQIGIEIPTFCYHPRLDIFGGCRMCLVEVEGWSKLETACTCQVSEGMVIYTDNEKVRKGRAAMLELLLVNHPLDCPVCDRSGDCDLQNLVFKYGSDETRFMGQKRVLPDNVVSPLIDRNINRCIQCKRCVRICDEVQGVAALGMAHRGAKTVVAPFMDKDLDCEFCGHCIYSCPVGCVTSMPARHAARTWEMEKAQSVCAFCSVGCVLEYGTRNDQVLKVSHIEAPGVNNASLCSKGFFGYDAFNHPDRIKKPMVRKDGVLQDATWEEALCAAADRLGRIGDDGGSGLVGGIASARLTNEELYLFQKLMRTGFGTNNIDTQAGTWIRKVVPVLEDRLGVWAATNSIEELAEIGALLVVGCDVTVSSPITGLKVKQAIRNGAKVTEINPSKSGLARLGSRTLRTPVGNEIALVKGMIRVILDEDLVDAQAASAVRNFSELEKTVRSRELDEIARQCGVEKGEIVDAAREFASEEKASLVFGETAALQPGGEDLIQALLDLMILTGKTGREGCGVYPVFSATNFQGAVDMGVDPAWLPGRVSMGSQGGKEGIEKAWGIQLPEEPGMSGPEMVRAALEGKLKALYLAGVDLFSTFPGGARAGDALEKLDFVVVQDLFMTETAKHADVVLPAASPAEKSGTLTSLERRIQKVTKAVKEADGSRPDWSIFCELGSIIGKTGLKFATPDDILKEIASVVPYYAGVDAPGLSGGGIQWPCSKGGTRGLLIEGIAGDRKAYAAVQRWDTGGKDGEYPFVLILGELLFHSGSFSRYSGNLNRIVSSASLLVNPQTAGELDLQDGSEVRISSRSGAVKVPVQCSDNLAPGVFFMARHFANAPASELMIPDMDGEPRTALVNVKIERA